MKDWLIAVSFVDPLLGPICCGRFYFSGGQRLPGSKAHPGALIPACAADVEESYGLAVYLKLVLYFAGQGHGRWTRQIYSAVLEFPAIKDSDRDKTAGLGLAGFAGPLQYAHGAQLRSVFGRFGYLARVLGGCRQDSQQTEDREDCLSCE